MTPPMTHHSEPAREAVAFQHRVQPWMLACFGEEISRDVSERNHRFLEEALELVQSTGCTASEAHQLVDYVFNRPIGETHQEIGGVMVTLAALCLALGEDMHAAAETELTRIWTKVEKIRAKQAAKPKHSPLPEHVSASPAPAAGGLEAVQVTRKLLLEWSEDFDEASKKFERLEKCVLRTRAQECRDRAALASPAATSAETQGGDGVRRWPFVESPGDFTARLKKAVSDFNGDWLAAVRHVLIERPAALTPSASAATRGDAGFKAGLDAAAEYLLACNDYGDRHKAGEIRKLAPPAPAVESAQVKVKPLEWVHGIIGSGTPLRQSEWRAGRYQIVESPSGKFDLRAGAYAICDTLDEAKAAAQADYEARIRASLDLATDAEG